MVLVYQFPVTAWNVVGEGEWNRLLVVSCILFKATIKLCPELNSAYYNPEKFLECCSFKYKKYGCHNFLVQAGNNSLCPSCCDLQLTPTSGVHSSTATHQKLWGIVCSRQSHFCEQIFCTNKNGCSLINNNSILSELPQMIKVFSCSM